MVYLLIVGDTHGDLTPLYSGPETAKERFDIDIDLILSVGDIGMYRDCRDWASLRRGPHPPPIPIVGVHGNHDSKRETMEAMFDQVPGLFLFPQGGGLIQQHGVTIFGVGGAYDAPLAIPSEGNIPYGERDAIVALERWTEMGSPPVDILLTHEAPTGLGALGTPGFGTSVWTCGSAAMRALWLAMRPRIALSGHYHSRHSVRQEGLRWEIVPEACTELSVLDTETMQLVSFRENALSAL